MADGKVGAPKGGRVHWLLWCLPRDFMRAYTLFYDYAFHNYAFVRYPGGDERRKPIDQFIIIRTSERCFRMMYHNFETNEFKYFSAPKSDKAGKMIAEIFEEVRRRETQNPR